jgi:hypothetical protein
VTALTLRLTGWSLACALVLSAQLAGRVRADADALQHEPTPAERAEYDELTRKGIMEYDLGHWEEAKGHFTRAYKLFPNARTLRALGLVAFELRSYVQTLDLLERALVNKQRPLTEAMRKDVSALRDDARSFVAQVTLTIEPKNAEVSLDGALVAPSPDGEQRVLLLDPGDHALRVAAPSYLPQTHALHASSGEASALDLTLLAADGGRSAPLALTPTAAVHAPQTHAQFWTTQRSVAVGLGAGAVVALGVGVTSGVLALSAKSAAKPNCVSDRCNAQGSQQRATAVTRADIASVGFSAGGGLLAAGLITYFLAPEPERAKPMQLSMRPGPGLAGVGVACRW